MAHQALKRDNVINFDVMHDNNIIDAYPIESWIAKGHPEWNEGAWVLSAKVDDKKIWKSIKSGDLGGYSIEAMVRKAEAIAEFQVSPVVAGFVEAHSDHDHAFFIEVDKNGVVVGGFTSFDNGHRHIIKFGTRTEVTKGHSHRYFLP